MLHTVSATYSGSRHGGSRQTSPSKAMLSSDSWETLRQTQARRDICVYPGAPYHGCAHKTSKGRHAGGSHSRYLTCYICIFLFHHWMKPMVDWWLIVRCFHVGAAFIVFVHINMGEMLQTDGLKHNAPCRNAGIAHSSLEETHNTSWLQFPNGNCLYTHPLGTFSKSQENI